jgi:hypothetical protein
MSQYVNVHDNDVTIPKIFKNARHNTYSVTSVVDPDPHGSAFYLGGWIWIWFRIGNMDPDPDPGGQK